MKIFVCKVSASVKFFNVILLYEKMCKAVQYRTKKEFFFFFDDPLIAPDRARKALY